VTGTTPAHAKRLDMHPQTARLVAGAAALTQPDAAPSLATCPLCHTPDPLLTEAALAGGADWSCATCRADWSAARVATVIAYRAWLAEHRPAQPAP
jgi:hypothetical protein